MRTIHLSTPSMAFASNAPAPLNYIILTIQDLAKRLLMIENKLMSSYLISLKAFNHIDRVPHMRLLHKLKCYGVVDYTHAWISDFLSNRPQKVLLNGVSSETSPVQSGVPQGSVLDPLLFLLFINDLPDTISSQSTVKLFTDDFVLYRKIECEEDTNHTIKLQQDVAGGRLADVIPSKEVSSTACYKSEKPHQSFLQHSWPHPWGDRHCQVHGGKNLSQVKLESTNPEG